MIYALGETYGNPTLIAQRTASMVGKNGDWWFPAAWFGFFFDLFVICTFFIFPKQRRFPNCITGLLCGIDMMHFLRELIRSSPIAAVSEYFFWSPKPPACYTLFLWVSWVEAADFVLVITLAVVIYRTIVRKEDVSSKTDPTFMRTVFITVAIYPVVWTCIVGGVTSMSGYAVRGPTCAPLSYDPMIMGIVQCFVGLAVMAVLLGISLRYPLYTLVDDKSNGKDDSEVYIWQVVRQVRNLSDTPQNRKAWLTIRFIIIMVLQTAPRVSYNIYYLAIIGSTLTPEQTNAGILQGYVIPPVCYWLNALVVLWGNKSLHKWLQGNVGRYVSLDRSANSTSTRELKMESIESKA